MNRNMIRMAFVASAIFFLALGLGGGYWWAKRSNGNATETASTMSGGVSQERKALYWHDPMVPDQHFDHPGKSPFMDMQLVPRYADDVSTTGVRIDPGLQQSVGIRTATVEVGALAPQIRVPATLTWDLREESMVSARVDGIVSRLNVKAPYTPVRHGQPLATMLAPAWSSAIAEARALGRARSASARSLQSAAQQRLRLLGLSGTHASRDGGVVLAAPRNGVVSEILVREGQSVMAGTPLFRINGTGTLWLEAAIPQAGIGGLGPGTPVEATVTALPGRVFKGEVETLLPQIDATSRTQRARIVLRNEDGLLVPGMFAELTLHSAAGAAVPLVPSGALVTTGLDSRVIVVAAYGSFQPVRVQTGRSSGGRTEILAGLKGGERVVTSGQFLIDSEASLSGALERLGTTPGRSPTPSMTPSNAMPDAMKPSAPTPPGKSATGKSKVLYWYDPMMPDQHFEQPGKSPYMDMQLVPKYADEATAMDSMDMGGKPSHDVPPQGDRP